MDTRTETEKDVDRAFLALGLRLTLTALMRETARLSDEAHLKAEA